MKKNVLSIVMILLCVLGYAQELPEIIPPSPTAFQLAKYGDIPINESTGKINPSIPIYNYKAGRLNIPISLNYQGNGVKVDQAASWTGINWNLNAGGVITRIVKDQDDLTSGIRKFYSYEDINKKDFYNEVSDFEEVSNHITSNIDSEADLFNFSFAGYSGSFFLDENMTPRLAKYDKELAIHLSTNVGITTITITTPEGVIYYFGGENAVESSKTIKPIAGGGLTRLAQTAFYLYKIKNYYGDEIYLEYASRDYQFQASISQVDQHKDSNFNLIVGTCPVNTSPQGYRKEEILTTYIEAGRFLRKITSNRNSFEVVFDFSDVNSSNTSLRVHYSKVLNGITVKEKELDTSTIMNVHFSYLYPKGANDSQRFFLSAVSFNDGKKYKMYYNKPEDLPNRFSFSQDHLGYYNGKANQTLLPRNLHLTYRSIYNYLADRSVDFKYAAKGALTKIVYPTKGYSTFEYEPTFTNKKKTALKKENILLYRNDHTKTPTNKNPVIVNIGKSTLVLNTEGETEVSKKEIVTQKINVKLSNVISTEHLDQHVLFVLNVKDSTTNKINNYTAKYALGDATPIDNYHNIGNAFSYPTKEKAFSVAVKEGHKYSFTFEIIANSFQSDAIINANIDFPYFYQTDSLEEAPNFRIKKVRNYTNDKVNSTKHYKYYTASKYQEPVYLYNSISRVCCSPWSMDYRMVNLVSSSVNTVYYEGVRSYGMVEIHSIDTEGTGFFIKKYFKQQRDAKPINLLNSMTNAEANSNVYENQRENKSVLNGTILKEEYYASRNKSTTNDYQLVKETNYFYTVTQVANVPNNIGKVLFNTCTSYGGQSKFDNLYLGMYHTYSNKIQLDSTVSKDYFYENNVVKKVKQKTTYTYDQYVGLPTEVSTIIENGEKKVVKNHYIENEISPIASEQEVLRAELKAKHNFSTPYKVESYRDTQKISTQSTKYKVYNHLILPEVIEISKSSLGLEDRVVYHSYDDIGNPTEVSKADGTHIVYIWGYHQTQPIAKIEGARLSDIPTTYIDPIKAASNIDNDRTVDVRDAQGTITTYVDKEGNLRKQLKKLHNITALKNAQITTYTYDPLIGVTSITDPRGETIYYEYDSFNRLEFVKDAQGNILKENKYNYKR